MRGREGGTGCWTRGKEVSSVVKTGGDGRGAVTLPTRPPPSIETILYHLGSFHFPPSSAVFSPSRTRWAVVPPEAGRLLGRGGVTTSGGPARFQPKRGNRWLLDRADGHGDFKLRFCYSKSAGCRIPLPRSPLQGHETDLLIH